MKIYFKNIAKISSPDGARFGTVGVITEFLFKSPGNFKQMRLQNITELSQASQKMGQ